MLSRHTRRSWCDHGSMLYLKVKFPNKYGKVVVRGDQSVARQCLVATINHEIKQKEQIELDLL